MELVSATGLLCLRKKKGHKEGKYMLYIPAGDENCHFPRGQSTCLCKNYTLPRPKCRLRPSDCYQMLLHRWKNEKCVLLSSGSSGKYASDDMAWCTFRITQMFKHNNTRAIPTVIRNDSVKCLITENTKSPDESSQTELVNLQSDIEEGGPFFGGQSNLNEIENNCASKFLDIGNESDSLRYGYNDVHTQSLDDKCKWDSDNDRSKSEDNDTVDPSSAFDFVEDEEKAAYITEDWFVNNSDLHRELDVSYDRSTAEYHTDQIPLPHSQSVYNTNMNALFDNFDEFKMDIPENLTEIRVQARELSDITFAENEYGEKIVYLTGDTAEIFLVYMIDLQKTVVAKKVKTMKFVDVLRETRIQQYLMSGQYVPEVLGLIGRPESQETIILQEFCAQGQTLYDAMQDSLSGELILLKEDWLKLSCNLAKSLDDMHQRGVLHNLLKSDNILIEFKQTDILDYFIGFSQATFRMGRRLEPPSGDSDSSDNSLYDDRLAPEVRHFLLSSPQSDIYSLGRIFIEIADRFCEELRPTAVAMCKDKPEERISLKEVIDSIEKINIDGA